MTAVQFQVYADEIFRSDGSRPGIVTVGTFDGVHLGHQEILKRLMNSGTPQHIKTVVTFEPHPQSVMHHRPGIMPTLTNTPEKVRLLRIHGVDRVFILKFDSVLANLSAEEFLTQILLKKLHATKLVVGYNHSFGKDRQGDSDYLKSVHRQYGFELEIVSPHQVGEEAISSTKIRKLLDAGNVEKASQMLGRPYNLSGTVITGRGVGRELRFPTANLKLLYPEKLIPKVGVYAVAVRVEDKVLPGMLNIGVRPTFGAGEVTIEVHLIDFDGDLYDKIITLLFLKRLRDEKRYDHPEELIRQMQRDREESLKAFHREPTERFSAALHDVYQKTSI